MNLEYQIIYSNRKSIALQISPNGKLIVRSPHRIRIKLLENFAFSYFDQNPISQLGLIITSDKLAIKHCELVGNPKKFVDLLHKLKKIENRSGNLMNFKLLKPSL